MPDSVFPTSLDTFVNPLGTDDVSVVDHALNHRMANDALAALETKVGITGSADTNSFDYKIGNLLVPYTGATTDLDLGAHNLISPIIIGGSAVGGSLELRSTSGVGTTDFIKFTVGSNGGTEAMRIGHTGNLAIGTTSVPSTYRLLVKGTVDTKLTLTSLQNSNTEGLWVYHTGSDGNFGVTNTVILAADYQTGASYRNLALATNGAIAMTIDTTSKVGIGTTSPSAVLDIYSANIAVSGTTTRGQLNLGANDALGADKGGALTFDAIADAGTSRRVVAAIAGKRENATPGSQLGYLAFYTTNSSPTVTERMRITSSGQVGIGAVPNSQTGIYFKQNFTGANGAFGVAFDSSVTPAANFNAGLLAIGAVVNPTITMAGSGTHPKFYSMEIVPYTVAGTGATITNGYSLHITGAPTGASNNYALAVDSGITYLNGNTGIGMIPTVRFMVKTTTATSAATDFQILDSAGAGIMTIRNDQKFNFGSGTQNTQLTISGTGAQSGIYSPAYSSMSNNIISYKDFSGNTRMTLDMSSGTSGLLGINVSPSTTLDVLGTITARGTTGTARFALNTTSRSAYIEVANSNGVVTFSPHSAAIGFSFGAGATLGVWNSTGLAVGATAASELLTLGTAGTTAGTLSLAGATSGKAIIQVAAAAGTPTLTLPTSTGTIALTSDITVANLGGLGTGVGTALAVNVGSAGAVVVNGGALGTPSSGTLTNATGLPIAGIVGDTTTALEVGSIELGHATDTTISRVSAGVISVEGVTVPTISSTNTLTNKRVTPRVTATAGPGATPTINTDNCDFVDLTALAADITSMTTNLSGTPTNGQKLTIRFKDNGTARGITWGTGFEACGVALPTTTVISKRLTVGFIYDTTTSKWGCVASAQEA